MKAALKRILPAEHCQAPFGGTGQAPTRCLRRTQGSRRNGALQFVIHETAILAEQLAVKTELPHHVPYVADSSSFGWHKRKAPRRLRRPGGLCAPTARQL